MKKKWTPALALFVLVVLPGLVTLALTTRQLEQTRCLFVAKAGEAIEAVLPPELGRPIVASLGKLVVSSTPKGALACAGAHRSSNNCKVHTSCSLAKSTSVTRIRCAPGRSSVFRQRLFWEG